VRVVEAGHLILEHRRLDARRLESAGNEAEQLEQLVVGQLLGLSACWSSSSSPCRLTSASLHEHRLRPPDEVEPADALHPALDQEQIAPSAASVADAWLRPAVLWRRRGPESPRRRHQQRGYYCDNGAVSGR